MQTLTPISMARVDTAASSNAPLVDHSRSPRVRIDGRLFRVGVTDWYLKGFTYGPFRPNSANQFLPERMRMLEDFAHLRSLGCNAIRLYHRPTVAMLDDALDHGIRVMIDVPWEKHRCFFEDWTAQEDAIKAVRKTAKELGRHPGMFALSVGNEIPHDIVRFYGERRIEKFIEKLVDTAKSEAPDCLVTYTNYPSTEFLSPRNLDFYCANVYLNDGATLGRYLDRLQHVAGSLPLILGEYGVDTIRNSESHQCEALESHLHEVFRRGLAGSFVFSYTDDWYTGGHQIKDWSFGVTKADRTEKPAAKVVSNLWAKVPNLSRAKLPRVSVVVCSYNGAATLEECLTSLGKLNYPDYEVILIDDGSTDGSRAIAEKFPAVRYIHQTNRGLSAARNVGAELSTGEIVAYTDSDCVADPHWLMYLVQAMQDQQVEAIGGPNVPPPSDSSTAKCVAASPGGPSHVMIDDRRSEHVPGCNMAFRRDTLLGLGGFDVQFRQAGDDVDLCWRWIEAGYAIGYAPAALVWHHRRSSVRAYFKQQEGYGRSEAMLQLKHPQRFNHLGYSKWLGVIYGEGAVGLPTAKPSVYHGKFGAGLFQIIYRRNDYTAWAYLTLFEWHVLAAMVALMGFIWPPALIIAGVMWMLTIITAIRAATRATIAKTSPWWSRPLIGLLHVAQPIVRAWHRYKYRFNNVQLPNLTDRDDSVRECCKSISLRDHDLYFNSKEALGREQLLDVVAENAKKLKWHGDFAAEWESHDIELFGDGWHNIHVRSATEELGWPKRFTRVRCTLRPAARGVLLFTLASVWIILAASLGEKTRALMGVGAWLTIAACIWRSRTHCRRAVSKLIYVSALQANLEPVVSKSGSTTPVADRAVNATEEAELSPVN
jgi:O-antigen biosynthesis protein